MGGKLTSQTTVAIVHTGGYESDGLRTAVARCLTMVGGLETLVGRGTKVFVKINHLSPPSPAERGIVTHPAFTRAILELLKETGADITVGDDVEAEEADGFAISGYREMCRWLGVKLVNLREAGFVARKCDGERLKEVFISRLVLDSDIVINLPKLKTHSLTVYTGAIKNMYGVIPAGLRRRLHGEYLRPDDFCRMLVDIFAVVKPHLTIMDGIVAMEGEGPGSGHLRNLGLLLASRDAVALDAVAGRIIGLNPGDVMTTRFAADRGLGIANLSQIQLAGESIESAAVADFKLPAAVSRTVMDRVPRALGKFAVSQVSPRPNVRNKSCTACGECVKACPTGAATIPGKVAEINRALCVRCMCCHEVCRFNAIVPRRPFFGSMIYGAVKAVRLVVRV
jgi:uncharacterized protein (DUF362 family)/NAD-dependent dihydropyrimidine dehydrogenase PreA subunit